ncbi:MAG TPA: rod-binding protein [Bdellovibrionales bacterium]|nr:rod-binding protein [Bdellovibrionales bacterium]
MKIQNGISLTPLAPEAKAAQQDAQLKDAAKMYETYFLNQMVKAMRSTVDREEGLMKPNFAEKIFSEQLDNQYVDGWANKGGVGLADMIYGQISEKFKAATKGALPIAPRKDGLNGGISDSIQMKAIPLGPEAKLQYRFEVPQSSGGDFEALAPMPGKILESKPLSEGWNLVKLDHGQGVSSEMTFPGQAAPLNVGADIRTGQRLGLLDSARPVLAWKLELESNRV